jgi:hypothetical protein
VAWRLALENKVVPNLFDNLSTQAAAINLCLGKKLVLPALMLLYAGIDVVAALERRPGEGTRTSFVRWVNSYMLKCRSLSCSALELYGARCGLLHTMAAESDLSRSGSVRQILYAWGTAMSQDLEKASLALGSTHQYVSVHISDLIESYNEGVINYLKDVGTDEARLETVVSNAGIWVQHLPEPILAAFLDSHRKSGDT